MDIQTAFDNSKQLSLESLKSVVAIERESETETERERERMLLLYYYTPGGINTLTAAKGTR